MRVNTKGRLVRDRGDKPALIKELDLMLTKITDAGLSKIAKLTRLTDLRFSYIRGITDFGLNELAGLIALERLWLCGTSITDAGLMEIAKLTWLKELDVGDTRNYYSGN